MIEKVFLSSRSLHKSQFGVVAVDLQSEDLRTWRVGNSRVGAVPTLNSTSLMINGILDPIPGPMLNSTRVNKWDPPRSHPGRPSIQTTNFPQAFPASPCARPSNMAKHGKVEGGPSLSAQCTVVYQNLSSQIQRQISAHNLFVGGQ